MPKAVLSMVLAGCLIARLPARSPDRRAAAAPVGQNRTQHFDRDPGWEGHNNRSAVLEPRAVRQDFGYQPPADGRPGGVGGFITPAAEPAYYAKRIAALTFEDRFSASGTLYFAPFAADGDGGGNTLLGFFNAETLNEWRTPNTVAFRINGRGRGFHPHLEYATARWRAGGEFFGTRDVATGKKTIRELPGGPIPHRWSVAYNPAGNGGGGTITATLGEETLVLHLEPGHRADGARFDRFGLLNVMKSADGGGTLRIEDLTINGVKEPLDRDPRWERRRNRATYTTANVRPRFDFGYSRTHFAGGERGEIGGLFFRGDQRTPERLACYGDRLETLTLDRPLRAAGRVCLRRGVTDSTTLFGFYHAAGSIRVGPEQRSGIPENFLGVAIEGPSREGFFFYPLYGLDPEGSGAAPRFEPAPPRILPNGKPHAWMFEYTPTPEGGGTVTTTLDGGVCTLAMPPAQRALGARFNRFGFVTTQIDGNGQEVYLDDLTYTCRFAVR